MQICRRWTQEQDELQPTTITLLKLTMMTLPGGCSLCHVCIRLQYIARLPVIAFFPVVKTLTHPGIAISTL